jgi:transcriptional regulator with XRE-family HTH domain
MQICMHARGNIENLANRIREKIKRKGISRADLAVSAGVHASQVSRICGGKFRRVSENVMRVCNVLGIEIAGGTAAGDDPLASRLQAEVLRAWDQSEEGADQLIRILRGVGALSSSARRKE